MLQNLKALVVVLAVAAVVFMAAKPVCLRFTAPKDFARRRIVWFVLTITAFVSPSFWLYALVAAPTMAWAARRDASPLALYLLLLFVIPPVEIAIPTIVVNRLFDLTQQRLLGLFVLLPMAWRRIEAHSSTDSLQTRWSAADLVLIAYGAWQLVLFMPYEVITNSLRRGFLFFLDTWLIYYAFSRTMNRKSLADSIMALCLSASIFAPLAVFESLRQWLLYTGIADIWGSVNRDAWLFRGDALRAQVGTGHSLTLGYILAMALGCWFYLKSVVVPKLISVGVFSLLLVGLFYTYSRGPWLTAALLAMIFLSLGSQSSAKFMKAMLLIVILAGAIAMTPAGKEIMNNLPFIGTDDQGTVSYRQQLAETSWALVKQHPFIGNPFVLLQMEELRQGQGIIDLVNAYAAVALFYGLIGLAMYLGVYVAVLVKAYACLKNARLEGDADMVLLGAALIACTLATLFFMATAGFAWLQWVFAGLLAGYGGSRARGRPARLSDYEGTERPAWPPQLDPASP